MSVPKISVEEKKKIQRLKTKKKRKMASVPYYVQDGSANDVEEHNEESEYSRGTFLPGDLDETSFGVQGEKSEVSAPQIDMPQRVAHPAGINAPARIVGSNRDEKVLEAFKRGDGKSSQRGKADLHKSKTRNNNCALTRLKDLGILAKTCRRAGRTLQESYAIYSQGVILDNLGKWKKAIRAYEQYLVLSEKLNDVSATMAACNCLGVAYYNLAVGGEKAAGRALGLAEAKEGDDADDEKEADPSQSEREQLNASLAFHNKHLDIADEPGQFVALTNMGLCYTRLNDLELAVQHHQRALRLAIELKSSHGQSLAVGNLSLTSAQMGDFATARACMDKHLHLVRDLHNTEAEGLACQKLGQIANKHGKYDDASFYFEQARKISGQSGGNGMVKLLNCSIGVTHGNMRMANYLKEITELHDDDED